MQLLHAFPSSLAASVRGTTPHAHTCGVCTPCKRQGSNARTGAHKSAHRTVTTRAQRPSVVVKAATLEAPLQPPTPLLPSPAAYYSPQTGYARHVLHDSSGCVSLKNFTLPQLEQWCESIGEPTKRAVHLWRWMYADGNWVRKLEDTYGQQNGVNPRFVDATRHCISTDGGLQLLQVARSQDGTRKLVFKLTGGEAKGSTIETVIIPVVRELGQKSRLTLCVSTQVGCAMNCQFCFTGRMGLLGNLTTAQIVEQVVEARRFLSAEGDSTPLTNLVYMGMGEPLNNLQAVMDSIDIVCSPLGLHVSHNKITVSTVGLVDEMRRFVPTTRAQLALSLHATTDEVRDWIVPVNRRYPLAQLIAALRELFPAPPPAAGDGPPAKKAQLLAATAAAAGGQQQQQQQQQQQSTSASTALSSASSSAPPPSSASAAAGGLHEGKHSRVLSNLGASTSSSHSTVKKKQDGSSGSSSSSNTSSSGSSSSNRSTSVSWRGRSGRRSQSAGKEPGPQAKATLLVEYIMLRGINDTLKDAHRLAQMMAGVACKINLIEFNPHDGTQFLPSRQEDVLAFRSVLIQAGHVCTVRNSRGDDSMAACGQLGGVDGGNAKPMNAPRQQQQQQQLSGSVVSAANKEVIEVVHDSGAESGVNEEAEPESGVDELRAMRRLPPLLTPPPRFQEVLRQQQEELALQQAR